MTANNTTTRDPVDGAAAQEVQDGLALIQQGRGDEVVAMRVPTAPAAEVLTAEEATRREAERSDYIESYIQSLTWGATTEGVRSLVVGNVRNAMWVMFGYMDELQGRFDRLLADSKEYTVGHREATENYCYLFDELCKAKATVEQLRAEIADVRRDYWDRAWKAYVEGYMRAMGETVDIPQKYEMRRTYAESRARDYVEARQAPAADDSSAPRSDTEGEGEV